MGLVSAIIALCKAVPVMERLFLGVADGIREAKAKARFEAKLDYIGDAIAAANRLPDDQGTGRREGVDSSPPVSESRTAGTRLD